MKTKIVPHVEYQVGILSALRLNKGITLRELSESTGIQITRLYRLEKVSELMLSEIRTLDAYYNVDLMQLTIPPLPAMPTGPRFKIDHNGVGYVIFDTVTKARCSMIMFKKQEAKATMEMYEEFPDRARTIFSKIGA